MIIGTDKARGWDVGHDGSNNILQNATNIVRNDTQVYFQSIQNTII